MRRGLYKTRAVVLNSFDYGESDRIVAFYTEDFGKIKGMAKGARRSRKRFVGKLEPGSIITLIFFYNGKTELFRVEDAALIEGFRNLRADIESLAEAYYLLELTDEMTRPGQLVHGVYGLLTGFLGMLDGGAEAALVQRFFEIKLLCLAGYLPHLVDCVVCRKPFGPGVRGVSFSSEKGGTVCGGCSPGVDGLVPLTIGTARLLETASRFDPEKLGRLRPGAVFQKEAETVLHDFIRYQIGKELNTKRFMSKLKKASI